MNPSPAKPCNVCAKVTVVSCDDTRSFRIPHWPRGAARSSPPGRSRSPPFWGVPIRASLWKLSSIKAWATMFVIRVAGNIVAPSQIGSVEFVAERFKTRLVVVLVTPVAAVIQATIEHLRVRLRDARGMWTPSSSGQALGGGVDGDGIAA